MQTRLNRQDEKSGFDVQSSVQRSPLSPILFEPEAATSAAPSSSMANPKLQLKRAQEYGFNFANLPLQPSGAAPIQRNAEAEEEQDVAMAQMKGDPAGPVQRDPDEDEGEDALAQAKLEGTVQREGEGEGDGPKVIPDGPRQPLRQDVQDHLRASGMHHAANTKQIVDDQAAKHQGALAYTTTQNGQAYTVTQQKVANDPKLQIHEATHGEQQAHLNIQPDSSNTLINSSKKYEAEADANADRFAKGQKLSVEGVQLKSQEDMA